jgi:hypothetical protein
MRCDDVQKMISDMQDGALSDRAERKVRRHMQSCEACRAFARRLGALQNALDSLPAVPGDRRRQDGYWDGLPGRVRLRLEEAAEHVAGRAGPLVLRPAGAVLIVLLAVALCAAAYEHGRTRALREHMEGLRARVVTSALPDAGGPPEAVGAAWGVGARQRRLFHEMNLAFADDLKWVATDGDRIDFGLARTGMEGGLSVPEGPIVGVGLAVSRPGDPGSAGEAGALSIVAFEGCAAEFAAVQAGVIVRFACTPRVKADGRVRADVRVVLSDPSTGARCGLQTEADLTRGREVEVGQVLLGSQTFVLRACAEAWAADEEPTVGVARL